MAEIGDMFTKKLDSAHLGIGTRNISRSSSCICVHKLGGAMRSLMELVKDKDPVLSKSLVS